MKKIAIIFTLALGLLCSLKVNNSISITKAAETDYVFSLKNTVDEWHNNAGNQISLTTSKGIKWTNFNGKSNYATSNFKEKVCLDGLSLTIYDDARNTPASGKEFFGFYFNGEKEIERKDYNIDLTFGIDPYKVNEQTRIMVGSSSLINTSGQAYKGTPCCYSSMESDAKTGLCAKTCIIIKNGMTAYDAINFSFTKMSDEFYKVDITDINKCGWNHGDNAPYNENGYVVTTYIKTKDILNYSSDGLVYLYALASSPSSSAAADAVICGIDDLKRNITSDKMTQIKSNLDTFVNGYIVGKSSSDYPLAKEYLSKTLTSLDRTVFASKEDYSAEYETLKQWATLAGDYLDIKLANGRVIFEEELEVLSFKNGASSDLNVEAKEAFSKITIDKVEVPSNMISGTETKKAISYKYLNTIALGKHKMELIQNDVIDKYTLSIEENDQKHLPYTSRFEVEVNCLEITDITFPIDINGAFINELTLIMDDRTLDSSEYEFKDYNTVFVLKEKALKNLNNGDHYLYMLREGVDGYFDIKITLINQSIPTDNTIMISIIVAGSVVLVAAAIISTILIIKKKKVK